MSFLRLCCSESHLLVKSNKLRNRNLVKCMQRQYSLLKQANALCRKDILTNQNRSIHQLRKGFRSLSSVLSRCGYQREASLVKSLAGQVRCFSTSRQYRNREDSDQEKQDKKDDDEKEKEKFLRELSFRLFVITSIVFTIAAFILLSVNDDEENNGLLGRNITWKEFYHDLLLKGEVQQIEVLSEGKIIVQTHPGAVVKGEQGYRYFMKLPTDFKFEEKIRETEKQLGISPENGVSIHYARVYDFDRFLIRAGLLMLVLYVVWNLFSGSRGAAGPSTQNMFDSIRKAKFTRVDATTSVGKHKITFKDVAGLQEAKVEVMEFVDYLKNPARYQQLGAKIPRGALLLGPPGCGKTLLAKAVATEAKVPFLAMAGSEFVEMVGGLGASRVRSLFQEARKEAPCIVYIDEIDAIGRQRGGGMEGSGEEEHTLNQLLVEMDGMGTVEGVIMLASTNRSDVLDKALLRPGRFDRHIMIDLPTLAERKEMFDMYLQKLKLLHNSPKFSEKLAQLTPRMTGADIANVCNEAALHAARVNKKFIDTEDFDYAVERVIAGVAKKTTVLGPGEKKIIAYHEAGHALVGWMLQHTDALLKVSIMPRTSSVLGFVQSSPSNKILFSKEMLFEQMCVALGGRVAESLIFNSVTTGAEDDLKKVTKLAYNQIRSYGMNDNIGYLSFPQDGTEFGTKPYSKKLAAIIDEEAKRLIARAYRQAEDILKEHKDKLHSIATTLLEKEVMTYDDIEKLIGPPPFGAKDKVEINILDTLDTGDNSPPEKNAGAPS